MESWERHFSIVLGICLMIFGGWLDSVYMYWINYVIWFSVGLVSTVIEIRNDIQIVYYFHVTLYNYIQTNVLKYILQASLIFGICEQLNTFCRRLLIFSICEQLQFLKIDNPSSLYRPVFFVSNCCPNKFNKNIPISLHTSALS